MKWLLLGCLLCLTLALEGVVELTDANFEEQVYSEPKLWLVMFSASWVLLRLSSVDIAPTWSPRSRRWPRCCWSMECRWDTWGSRTVSWWMISWWTIVRIWWVIRSCWCSWGERTWEQCLLECVLPPRSWAGSGVTSTWRGLKNCDFQAFEILSW